MLRGARQRLFAVRRLQQLIAVLLQPRDQNVAVGFVVVDHQDSGGVVHGNVIRLGGPANYYGRI